MSKRLLCLALAFALLAMGCAEEEKTVRLPAGETLSAVLFYPRTDLGGLARVELTLSVASGESFAQAALKQLLNPPAGCLGAAGAGGRLALVEDTRDVVTAGVIMPEDDERLRALCALAVWQTLCANTKVQGVNVLINGVCPAWKGEALNTLGRAGEPALEFDALVDSARASRAVTVYRAHAGGKYMIPQIQPLPKNMNGEKALFALLGTHDDDGGFFTALPEGFEIGDCVKFSYGFTRDGRRVLELAISDPDGAETTLAQALEAGGMQSWQFIASFALTLTTCLSDVERVRFLLNGAPVEKLTAPDGSGMTLENAMVARRTFSPQLAGRLKCCLPDATTGELRRGYCAARLTELYSATALLERCLPDALEPGEARAAVTGGAGILDISRSLYRRAAGLDEKAAHALLYRMVNALCDNLGASCVRLYVEGGEVKYFSGFIRADGKLYPDHGLGR